MMVNKEDIELTPLTKKGDYYPYEVIVELTSELTCKTFHDEVGSCEDVHNSTWWKLLDEVEGDVFDYLNIEMSSEHDDNRYIYTKREVF